MSLTHGNNGAQPPERVVVIGAAGFVGGAVMKRLAALGAPTLGLSRKDVDLTAVDAGTRLAAQLRPGDSVVAVAARAPVKNAAMLAENAQMIRAFVEALQARPVAHVVNISSDAVYADGPLPLTEASPMAPTSLHGAMHLAREIALSGLGLPIAHLRPTLIHGEADPHGGYGPNKFRRLIAEGQDIVLFGEGEERRDHVAIDDVAEAVVRVLFRRSTGSLNVATGEVTSFRDIAVAMAKAGGDRSSVKGSPRSGPMPHGGYRPFDIAALRHAFPDWSPAPLSSLIAGRD